MTKHSNHRSLRYHIVSIFIFCVAQPAFIIYLFVHDEWMIENHINQQQARHSLLTEVAKLEKNVVDLKHATLLFKTTDSHAANRTFDRLAADIEAQLHNFKENEELEKFNFNLEKIAFHLREYKEDFAILKSFLEKRKTIESNLSSFNTLSETLKTSPNLDKTDPNVIDSINLAKELELQLFYFIHDPSYSEGSPNPNSYKTIKYLLGQTENGELFYEQIDNIKKEFNAILTLARNYNYLTSVVMPGIINEILYNSGFINDTFNEDINKASFELKADIKKRANYSISFSIIIASVALFIVISLSQRIFRAIRKVTSVFEQLSRGDTKQTIKIDSNISEIAKLEEAAITFQNKNQESIILLEKSEKTRIEIEALNRKLKDQVETTQKALAVRTDFLANMSHELRTPMNSIIGFSARILKNTTNYEEKHIRAIEIINRSGKHLLRLINDILDLSKLEANQLEVNIQPTNIANIIANSVTEQNVIAEEKGLRLVTESDEITIDTDEQRLTQILNNLISNAIKYSSTGTIKCKARLSTEDSQLVEIAVSDEGIGIPKENLALIFGRFQQVDVETKFNVGQGTGLGLSITHNLVELLGGRISVESEIDEGSCFTVTLPIKQ